MNTGVPITAHLVPEAGRGHFVHVLFGRHFPMLLEPTIFNMAGMLAKDYRGGYWQFHALSSGGFFMAPEGESAFDVACDNGFEGRLSAEALGIVASLYAYSHCSFAGDAFAVVCAGHFHLLRDFAMDHSAGDAILAACD